MRITILTAGQTIDAIALRRAASRRWIREGTGRSWPGRWHAHDLRVAAPLPRPHDADAFVMTGSSSSVTERAPWMLRAEALVRDIVAADVPLLGICFGHQMIAQALGGRVERNPRGREIGTVRVTRVKDDPLFMGLPRAFDVNATHVDAVTRLPPGAEVLATTTLDDASALSVGRHVRGVQFHPEFDDDVMRGYLHARADILRQEGANPDALAARVHSMTRGREILSNFVRSIAR